MKRTRRIQRPPLTPRRFAVFATAIASLFTVACGSGPAMTAADFEEMTPGQPAAKPAPRSTHPYAHPTFAISNSGFCQVLGSGGLRCRDLALTSPSSATAPPTGRFSAVVSHGVGYCGLSAAGRVVCWRGATAGQFVPSFSFGEGRYVALASDARKVCALTATGDMDCAAPESNIITQHPPVSGPVRIAGGGYRNMTGGDGICALTDDAFYCLANVYPKPGVISHPTVSAIRFGRKGRFVKAVQTWNHACGLRADGRVRCRKTSTLPRKMPSFPHTDYVNLIAGGSICAQRANLDWICDERMEMPTVRLHKVAPQPDMKVNYLVGLTDAGYLMVQRGTLRPPVKTNQRGFTAVYNKWGEVCGVRADGSVYCEGAWRYDDRALRSAKGLMASEWYFQTDAGRWGFYRRKPVGGPDGVDIPVYGRHRVKGRDLTKGRKLKDVQQGVSFGCGIRRNKTLACWGTIQGSRSKTKPPANQVKSYALGTLHGCAISLKGRVICWGNDYYHNLSNRPKTGTFVELRTSPSSTCARRDDGAVLCWGQRFDGLFELPFHPKRFVHNRIGTCAETDAGAVQCWGGRGGVWN